MNFKADFMQVCFQLWADFIQRSFHFFVMWVISWSVSINRALLFLFFDLHCGFTLRSYIIVRFTLRAGVTSLYHLHCGFTLRLYMLVRFTLRRYMLVRFYIAGLIDCSVIVQVTLTSWRLNCWSPSLSPVLFPVVADPVPWNSDEFLSR